MKKKVRNFFSSPLLAAIICFVGSGLNLFIVLRNPNDDNGVSSLVFLLFLAGGVKHLYRYLYGEV